MKLSTKPLLIAALIAFLLILAGGTALTYFPPESASYCLGCHSGSQLWPQDDKTAFTNTGHFKMLRVVTPGKELLGPDGQHYTDPGFNWSAGTYTYNGTTYKMSYIFGGMLGFNNIFGNAANPGVVDNTGMIVGYGIPYATSSCAMCHTTGYRWWDGNVYGEIQAFNAGGILDTSAPTSAPTSSLGTVHWNENGVSCIRCHYYQKRLGSNWWNDNDMWAFYADTNINALCGKCHQGPYNNGFMNSPHARFSGAWAQLADPSQYNSDFIRNCGSGCSGGCTECHDVHKSVIGKADASKTWWGGGQWTFPGREEVNATYCSNSSVSSSDPNLAADCAAAGGTVVTQEGAVKNCVACHNGSSAVTTINHSMGPGTPFTVYPSGGATDPTDACYVCHMPSGKHLFRITPDPNYSYTPQDATTCINSVPGGYGSWTPNCSLPAGTSWTSATCATVGGTWDSNTNTCTLPAATCTSVGGTWDITTGTCTGTLTMPSPFVTSTTCASAGAALGVTATYAPGCKDTRDGSAAGKATSDGTWQYAQWNDLDMSCGQCHGGTGGPTATVSNAPYFTKVQLSAAAKGIHTDILDPGSCLVCHNTAQGPMAAVVPGTNHHSGTCTDCHNAESSDGLKPHDKIIPVTTDASCMGCHTQRLATMSGMTGSDPGDPTTCVQCHTAGSNHIGVLPTDIQAACGQCHGGSKGPGGVLGTDPYYSLPQLTQWAVSIHNASAAQNATASFASTRSATVSNQVSFDASASSCNAAACNTFTWDFGDSGAGTTTGSGIATPTHTYTAPGSYTVTLTVTNSGWLVSGTTTKAISAVAIDTPPSVATPTCSVASTTGVATLTYSATDDNGVNKVVVAWGDNSVNKVDSYVHVSPASATDTHTYVNVGTYTATVTATDTTEQPGVNTAICTYTAPANYNITGTVKNHAGTVLSTASVTLKYTKSGLTKSVYSGSNGSFTFTNVPDGTAYSITVTKVGYTFPTTTGTVSGGNVTGIIINAN